VVHGHAGAVSVQAKARDLQRAEAEGRPALFERQLGVLAARGEADLYRGNTARLLVDGPHAFAAMRAALEQARRRVLLEMYIVEDDGVAAEFAALLLRKAAEGVSVALMYDAVGSIDSDKAFFERLQQGGVQVCEFNPLLRPSQTGADWRPWQRNHRKVLVVDGDIAFTGGINLSNVYASGSGGSRGPDGSGSAGGSRGSHGSGDAAGWCDTQVELRGPVVQPMAAAFRTTWQDQGCSGVLPADPEPRQPNPGTRIVKMSASDPREGLNRTYAALLAAIGAAQRSVYLTMAYFAPGDAIVDALREAAGRGVDVRLVLPGRSDAALVMHAARSYYDGMLSAGVRIHEMHHAVMHAKTAVIDGVFSSVGSSNLDGRSIDGNHELDVVVLGEDFGSEMEALFSRDLQNSRVVNLGTWRQRGLGARLMEWLGRALEPLL
jgi:cardiolipin synthase